MMRLLQIFGLIYVLFLSSPLFAQDGIVLDESGYKAVLERSKKEHKPVFYMMYTTWCTHCAKMKSEVFKDTAVANLMNKNFICASQDIDKGEGQMFKSKFKVKSFPTFLFLDENGTELYLLNGEYKTADFIREAKAALNPKQQIPYLEQQFMNDPGNADKCIAIMTALKKGRERSELSPYAQKYLSTLSDAQLVTENNWKIIANGVTDIESREFQYVLKHQKEFAAVSSPTRVKKKIINLVSEYLKPYTENLDSITYLKKRPIAKAINLHTTDSLIFTYDLLLFERTKNWTAYKKTAVASTEQFVWTDLKALKEIAQNYLLHIDDAKSLKLATTWALHTHELKESYESYMLIAKLYQKQNDLKSAILYATKARDLGKQMGWQAKDAGEMLLSLGVKS